MSEPKQDDPIMKRIEERFDAFERNEERRFNEIMAAIEEAKIRMGISRPEAKPVVIN
jgi:hypothetical protein